MQDAVIIGGGLAGAAAACHLARAGRTVTLIERQSTATDKMCGEFLSREAQLHLRRLDIDPAALGGHGITHLRLIRNGDVVQTRLPFAGLGLTRRVLDEALLQHAAACGAEVHRGQAGRFVEDRFVLVGDTRLSGRSVLLATGKHDLASNKRARPGRSDLVGFKSYFALSPAQSADLVGHVEVIIFPDGYAGLQHVEAGQTNLCLLVSRARLRRVGGSWDRLLDDLCASSPHLCNRLTGARTLLQRPLSIAGVPYGYVYRGREDGLFRLGDQVGVIDSFSGDGMSIALHSAALAARTVVLGGTTGAYHQQMRADIAAQIGRAHALYHIGRRRPRMLMSLVRFWPGSLRLAARLTRVPERALARGLA